MRRSKGNANTVVVSHEKEMQANAAVKMALQMRMDMTKRITEEVGGWATAPKISIRNPTQQQYVNKMNNGNTNIVIAVGPSGTGKTLLAVQIGIQKLMQKNISKIVLTRPTVSVDDDIGFKR